MEEDSPGRFDSLVLEELWIDQRQDDRFSKGLNLRLKSSHIVKSNASVETFHWFNGSRTSIWNESIAKEGRL